MIRRVRGNLFVDYVRMIRGNKRVDWTRYLLPEDRAWLDATIDPDGWYPMETFERFGIGIVREIAGGQLAAVHMWGRFQVEGICESLPTLVARGDPRETLMRFHALHRGFFDYEAVVVEEALDDHARVRVQYAMSAEAEAAACHQTLGFFERLVELSGAHDVKAELTQRSWEAGGDTILELSWTLP